MTLREIRHAVWLRSDRVGTLVQRGDHTRFVFSERYLNDPDRPVLGLVFEQNLSARHAAALRLPCWFSNLLPEGRLREWIAADRSLTGLTIWTAFTSSPAGWRSPFSSPTVTRT
jgi:serine/threonine-protein kinase HipA